MQKLQNFVWVLWILWISHFEPIIILKQFLINNTFVGLKVRTSTSNKTGKYECMESGVKQSGYIVIWCYIEKAKLIHQLFFVILVCLLPPDFKAYRLKKLYFQKQPPRGAPRKRCSENMQQIYRRTLMCVLL